MFNLKQIRNKISVFKSHLAEFRCAAKYHISYFKTVLFVRVHIKVVNRDLAGEIILVAYTCEMSWKVASSSGLNSFQIEILRLDH